MEEDASSMISNAKTNGPSETSSGTSNYASRPSKRSRHDQNVVLLGRFKGVVPHNNGSWGAQIYANHRRFWLGTFRSEKEAAMAYDSAAIKLRRGDSPCNFPWTGEGILELDFQNLYTADAVLKMIREGTYQSRFADFLKSKQKKEVTTESLPESKESFPCILLFQKELTPSDVGSLNRLVIPKKYAVKYFPNYIENEELFLKQEAAEDVELVFYDKEMKIWKFRYCYWKSSQSFVLTRGWNKFVKEKKLRPRDVITFYSCRDTNGRSFIIIHPEDHSGQRGLINKNEIVKMEPTLAKDDLKLDLDLKLGKNLSCRMDLAHEDVKQAELPSNVEKEVELPSNVEKKEFRLFGVQIIVE